MSRGSMLPRVAYFCMEFGLDPQLPIYAGGLGILAGDILKGAKQYGYPMVGIGILWEQGYTHQFIGKDGWPYNVPQQFPRHLVDDTGAEVEVFIRGKNVRCKVWSTEAYDNAPLYLLDTNTGAGEDAWITRQLYGGVEQDRVASEMVLGIGGVRALKALGIDVDVYHFNEGHAIFGGIELIRSWMEGGCSFEEALRKVRNNVVFTTHTPVPAGNETHDHSLLKHMGAYNTLNYWNMARIGDDPFNMTVAGLRLSHIANGVAKLHAITSSLMWQDVRDSAPIIGITNGVHVRTWQHPAISQAISDNGDLLAAHSEAKRALLDFVRGRTGVTLRPECLVIGFARRVAAYKRGDLIFQRRDVIDPLLQDGTIQLVFAGKSHPSDEHAKSIISQIHTMSQRFKDSVVFLEDYDMRVARLMVAGCDVWLNNPQRPLEASGTSGMKAAMNGVLNLSILDGWWPEGCIHGITGWQIGCGYEGQGQNECDLISLYEVLIDDVIPTYYLDKRRWAEMMKRSIHMAVERFSIARVLPEYYNLMYQPMVSQKLLRDITGVSTDTIAAKTSLIAAVKASHKTLSNRIPGNGANPQREHRSESPPLL